jgi:hypothetical protein
VVVAAAAQVNSGGGTEIRKELLLFSSLLSVASI